MNIKRGSTGVLPLFFYQEDMQCSEKKLMATTEMTYLPNNPRTITNDDLKKLMQSIRDNGFWPHRPCAVEWSDELGKYVVLDGNQRLKACRRMKIKQVPVQIYSDLTDIERDEIVLRSNVNNGQWDTGILQSDFQGIDFEDLGLRIELPEPPDVVPDTGTSTEMAAKEDGGEDDEEEEVTEDKMKFYHDMLGDYLYPSNNDFDIPTLLADNQPVHLELPFTPWGVESRHKKGITTYHFYVDDYRFEKLFKDPLLLLLSGCKAVVEPNCSIHDQTPVAHGIYQIYRKRYLARYLQECGMQVWVDLNVAPRFEDINALGVPEGYNAFFTRGVSGWIATTERHWEMAKRISGKQQPNMCVYGGGKDIEQWCRERGIVYIHEFINHMKTKK